MIVRNDILVTKGYFITALTYAFFQQGRFREITKGESIKIVRDRLYWSGRGNWHGANTIVECLGDGGKAIDRYNEIHHLVEEWVTKNFPELE